MEEPNIFSGLAYCTEQYSRHSAQKIRIIYRDIGEWDYDDAAEAEQQQPQVVAVTVTQPELLPA